MGEKLKDQVRPAITVGVSHLFLVGVMIVFCNVRVPHYLDVYQDLEAELPTPTKLVLNAGSFIATNWYWLIPPIAVLLAGDIVTFMLIRKHKNDAFARVWAWAVIGLLGIILAASWLAVRLPLAGLTRGVS